MKPITITCALGAVEALLAAGLQIPEDIAVTGYDDTPVSQLKLINLTSVCQPPDELADLAVTAAIRRLEGNQEEHRLVSAPELRPRGSSGRISGTAAEN
ncbi:substrate-binding domain-containing protein [Glutamicibacter sp. NPDC087344]|uniref:substrate-binding domain-containing protein n=1 Tax=Glutamicibacter sp. NPDC087344 TaxID=3363994 RepID=UPI0038078360